MELDENLIASIKGLKTVSGEYSEMLIRGQEGFRGIGRLALDRKSLVAYSSDPNVFEAFNHLHKEGLTTAEAMDRIIEIEDMQAERRAR